MATTEKMGKAVTHTKEQLIASNKFANRRDLISALLEDGKTYTLKEVEALIENFKKGGVK